MLDTHTHRWTGLPSAIAPYLGQTALMSRTNSVAGRGGLPAVFVFLKPSSSINRKMRCDVSPSTGSEVQEGPTQVMRYEEEAEASQKDSQLASHALSRPLAAWALQIHPLSSFLSIPRQRLLVDGRIGLKEQFEARDYCHQIFHKRSLRTGSTRLQAQQDCIAFAAEFWRRVCGSRWGNLGRSLGIPGVCGDSIC